MRLLRVFVRLAVFAPFSAEIILFCLWGAASRPCSSVYDLYAVFSKVYKILNQKYIWLP